jgi:acetolactate synthase-1/2/3 large subunit
VGGPPRRWGVVLTTLGPGALNLATGAAYAHFGGMPVIMITGQKGIRTAEQAAFQMVNTVATMDPLTKVSQQTTSAAMIPTMVREAFRAAQAERPGPVHLELPEDIAGLPIDGFELIEPHTNTRPVAGETAIANAANVIREAKKPLLMLGADASRASCSESLSSFVAGMRIPYVTTQMGKGSVTGASDLYMGTAALTSGDYVHDAIDEADVFVIRTHEGPDEDRFIPQRIVQEVRDVMPVDEIVALDNGMYKIRFARNYRTTGANTLLLTFRILRWSPKIVSEPLDQRIHRLFL